MSMLPQLSLNTIFFNKTNLIKNIEKPYVQTLFWPFMLNLAVVAVVIVTRYYHFLFYMVKIVYNYVGKKFFPKDSDKNAQFWRVV